MIQSMTGYGKADCEINGKKITVEIKSLNSKQLDLSIRMIGSFKDKEMEIRNEIQRRAERGKIEVNIYYDSSTKENILYFNEKVFQAYLDQINTSAEKMGINPPEDPWTLLLKMPEVFKSEIIEDDQEENWSVLKSALDLALDRFSEFRIQEGKMLENVFKEKISRIESYLEDIKAFETERIDSIKSRITDSLEKLGNVDYDKNRFEQEMIYYIEKLDVNEEKARLANHLTYFIETMNDSHGQGKKLGFITQEIGREVNTLGSKSNHTGMQQVVVCMKDELEQIKEQVLNVL
jgi:uncharacterized protein (TIGR00255 family)